MAATDGTAVAAESAAGSLEHNEAPGRRAKGATTALRLSMGVLATIAGVVLFRADPRLAALLVVVVAAVFHAVPMLASAVLATRRTATAGDADEEQTSSQADTAPAGLAPVEDAPTHPGQLRQTLTLTALQLWLLAALAVGADATPLPVLHEPFSIGLYYSVFAFAIVASLVSFGVEAIAAGKLPPKPGGKPEHKHISGAGALALFGAVFIIITLATWATIDRGVNRAIHAQWGAWIVYALALAFLLIAILPSFSTPRWLIHFGAFVSRFLRPIGHALSAIDSVLVHCVAPAAGATLRRRWLGRYAYLGAYMVPLGVMGYWLPAPLGLIPIAWALLTAISVSRRWAWVEDDRETAMLTAQFRSENLRVGFGQDLRDEALLAFMSMFFLLPLALRQAHDWGSTHGLVVFTVRQVDAHNLFYWIQFFGAELAKAVPFVDWAEIYDVEGEGPIETGSSLSRHIVFATRVLVDLVFLAALLQALSTIARNAKQREMFAVGSVDRFDPFIEKEQFQRIVTWEQDRWVRKDPDFDSFGAKRKYNLTRLLELKEDKEKALQLQRQSDRRQPDWAVWAAAELLYARDYQDGDVAAELHVQLRQEAGVDIRKSPNKDALDTILDELEKPNRLLQVDDLNDVRVHLNQYSTAWHLRQRLITLIGRGSDDPNSEDYQLQIAALVSALAGEKGADARAPNRRLAFDALKPAYLWGEREAVMALRRAAQTDQSGALAKDIAAWIGNNPRDVPPEQDSPWPTG